MFQYIFLSFVSLKMFPFRCEPNSLEPVEENLAHDKVMLQNRERQLKYHAWCALKNGNFQFPTFIKLTASKVTFGTRVVCCPSSL